MDAKVPIGMYVCSAHMVGDISNWRGANQCCVLLLQLCSRYELFFFQQPRMRRHPSECEVPIGTDELRIAVVHHAGKKLRRVWDRTLATYLTFGNEWSLCHANPL